MKRIDVATALVIGLSACDQPTPAPSPSPSPVAPAAVDQRPIPDVGKFSERAVIQAHATLNAARRIVVEGETNLPGGTRLLADVLELGGDFGEAYDEECAVSRGRFFFSSVGDGQAMPALDGVYQIIVRTSGGQPQTVTAVLGERGERMRGPDVRRDRVDLPEPEQEFVLEVRTGITVGDSALALARRRAHKKLLTDTSAKIRAFVARGRMAQRHDWQACMSRMQADFAEVKALRNEVDEKSRAVWGSGIYSWALGDALGCMSCDAPSYEQKCRSALEFAARGDEVVRKLKP